MSELICPNCKAALIQKEKCCVCENGHSFDVAKQGYVNLLLSQKSSLKRHGDDGAMVKARTDFLDGGFYKPLLDCLVDTVGKFMPQNGVLLDVGCGDGYYTAKIADSVSKDCRVYGTDISKTALIAASHRSKNINLCVSSVSYLPFKTGCADVVISVFAPHNDIEFYRVLKKSGVFIRVIPLEKHLFSLKSVIYDKPYENVPDMPTLFGFSLSERYDIKYNFTVGGSQIKNLFMMTPYYYKTSARDQSKLDNIPSLETEAEFAVLIYKKV